MPNQATAFVSAINTFRAKYGCIPGDCANATDFFGEDEGSGTTACDAPGGLPNDRAANAAGACNGNGDGTLDGTYLPGATAAEGLEAWRQLAKAQLISGSYSGSFCDTLCPGNIVTFASGYNCPAVLDGPVCWLMGTGAWNGSGLFYYMSLFPVVAARPSGTYLAMHNLRSAGLPSYALSPSAALFYDSKYDDGQALTGNVIVTLHSAIANCLTGYVVGANYAAAGTGKESASCNMMQRIWQ